MLVWIAVLSLVGKWRCDFSTGYYGYVFRADGTGTSFELDYSDHVPMNSITYVYNSGKKTLLINDEGDKEEYKVRKLTSEESVLEDSYGDSETYYREE